ncbi:hypothetical protein DFJ77DRAFT_139846 [Powellomyces hirtus]|nr:hypothetical protein DFJ77DRAFT_139846 [Powellomyces hirtus]
MLTTDPAVPPGSSSQAPSDAPQLQSTPSHPRIQTESKHDIAFLKSLLQQHALASLQPHTVASPDAALLDSHINSWVERTFALASHSILVNGVPYAKAMERAAPEYEQLDESLSAELDAAHSRLVEATVRVARLRKTVPTTVREIINKDLASRRGEEKDCDVEAMEMEKENDEPLPKHHSPSSLVPELQKALAIPATLNSTLPTLAAKLGRADIVIRDLEAEAAGSTANPASSNPFTPSQPRSRISPPRTDLSNASQQGRAGLLNALG